jgi:putative tryptophan/tyrosine transport system substrate-binding protein
MRRRDFIKGIAGSAAGWPIALHAQSAGAMQRVGWLDLFREDDPFVQGRAEAVREDLAKAGWIVGRNLQIDYRWGVTTPELAQRLGGELLSLSPDVILCAGTPGVKSLKQATSKVPIVFVLVAEPVDQGIVKSLDHPGANITGFAYLERTIGEKWFGLLMEVAPRVKRIAIYVQPQSGTLCAFLL